MQAGVESRAGHHAEVNAEEDFDLQLVAPEVNQILSGFHSGSGDSSALLALARKLTDHISPFERPLPPKPFGTSAACKGGGVKVTAYLGVIMGLDERKLLEKIERVAGSSGGCIITIMLALGFNADQIVRMFNQLDLTDFTDHCHSKLGDWFGSSMFGQFTSVLVYSYIFSGENMRAWISGLLEHVLGDEDATFADLKRAKETNPTLKDVYFTATKIRPLKHEIEETVFGFNSTPHVRIRDAFCASTALPTIYKPVDVYEKITVEGEDGSNKYELKYFGKFNDGGVLNNFPNQIFDTKEHCDHAYPLSTTNYKGGYVPTPVNPNSVGFSLITHLRQLDNDITPLTDDLHALIAEKVKAKPAPSKEKEHFHAGILDIARSIWLYYVGKFSPEDSEQKYATHPETTVQIYAGEVGTTEFDLSDEKAERVIGRGKDAVLNWLDKFKRPQDPYNLDDYNTSLTKAQKTLKRRDRQAYYRERTASRIIEFIDELDRYQHWPIEDLCKNVRLVFLAYKIKKSQQKMTVDSEALFESAYELAMQQTHALNQEKEEARRHLEVLADLTQTLMLLKKTIALRDNESIRRFQTLFKGQLSKIFKLCLQMDDNLCNVAAQSHPELLPYIKEQLDIKNRHLYQINRGFSLSIEQMLNQVPPTPILLSAHQRVDTLGVEYALGIGLDPTHKHLDGLTAIHHAIAQNRLEIVMLYLDWMRQHKKTMKDVVYGPLQQPLMHYMLEVNTRMFLDLKTANYPLFKNLYLQCPEDINGITLFELLSQVDIGAWGAFPDELKGKQPPTSKAICISRMAAKSQIFSAALHVAKAQLYADDKFHADKIPAIKKELLLALLADKTVKDNVLASAVIAGEIAFVQTFIEQCVKHDYFADIYHFVIGNKIEGKTLITHATEHNQYNMVSYLVSWREDSLQRCNLPSVGERLAQSSYGAVSINTKLHLLAKEGSKEDFYNELDACVKAGEDIEKILCLMNDDQKCPLQLLLENGREELLEDMPAFLQTHQSNLATVFGRMYSPGPLPQVQGQQFKAQGMVFSAAGRIVTGLGDKEEPEKQALDDCEEVATGMRNLKLSEH